MKNMKKYLKIIRYKNRIIINNLIENIFPTMSGQRYEIWNQLVLKGMMAKTICSSAPKWETVLEQFLFCFTLTHIKRNRKGGSENSPVDYFPDAARRFRPSVTLGN